jgi:hypothetical protein
MRGVAGGRDKVLQVRQCRLAQRGLRGEQPQVPDKRARLVGAVGPAGQQAARPQLGDEAVRGRRRQTCAAGKLGERQGVVGLVEGGEQRRGSRHARMGVVGPPRRHGEPL